MAGTFYDTVSDGLAQHLWNEMSSSVDLTNFSPDNIAELINAYLVSIAPKEIKLSEVSPDFEQIAFQFRRSLSDRNSWNDPITAATNQTLVEMVSAGVSYGQLSVERAAQEVVSDTARMPSSQRSIARMMGVHIRRKTPAKVIVDLSNEDFNNIYNIPAYTQFTINQVNYFNRKPIVFNIGQTEVQNVELFEGLVETKTFISDGSKDQRFVIGSDDFKISDVDLICISEEGIWQRVHDGLWRYKETDRVFFENTLPDGRVELLFGDNIYGKIPRLSSNLIFTWATTSGSNGNTANAGVRVEVIGFTNITGRSTTSAVGGDDELDVEVYRTHAPHMYRAKGRAVTRTDHEAIAFDYPGIVDVIFQGQAETNPDLKEWMNVVVLTAVTKTPWTALQWEEFFDYIQNKSIWRLEMIEEPPTVINCTVDATVYCDNTADLRAVYIKVNQALNYFFRQRRGMLGFSVFISDIHATIIDSDRSINYVELNSPALDIPVTKTQYVKLVSTDIRMSYATRSVSPINGTNDFPPIVT